MPPSGFIIVLLSSCAPPVNGAVSGAGTAPACPDCERFGGACDSSAFFSRYESTLPPIAVLRNANASGEKSISLLALLRFLVWSLLQ